MNIAVLTPAVWNCKVFRSSFQMSETDPYLYVWGDPVELFGAVEETIFNFFF